MAEGFVEEGGAGYGGVERLNRTGDVKASLRQGEGCGREACSFVADHEGGVGGEVGFEQRDGVEALRDCCVDGEFLVGELRGDLSEGCADDGEAEDGAGGGADDLGVPLVGGVGREEDLLHAEGFGGAEERAEVAGILKAFEDKGDGLGTGCGRRDGGNEDGCGNALGRGGFDGAGEDIAAEGKGGGGSEAGERGTLEDAFAALAEEEGFEGEAGAEGLGDEVLAFEAEEVAGLRGLAAEGGAEDFDAGVGLARDGGGWRHDACDKRR